MNVNQSVNAAKAAKSSIIYWEQLFRGRIILQKSLQIANQLPVVDDLLELAEEEDMKMSTDITTSQTMLKSLLEELVGQQTLSVAANEQQRPNKKGKQSSSSTNPSFADEDEAWQAIHTTDEMLMQSKWRPALTAMHRKVNGFSGRQSQQQKELKVFQTSFWDKIDAACLDESYGLRKSRLPAMASPRLGLPPSLKDKDSANTLDKEEYLLHGLQKANKKTTSNKEDGTDGEDSDEDSEDEATTAAKKGSHKRKRESQEYLDLEVYDDSSFYSQLLKHYVNASSDKSNNMLDLQELRKLKQRRSSDVDRKASKGRKIRYVVHAKLQNFMFPRPDIGSSVSNHASLNVAQETLFASLFQ